MDKEKHLYKKIAIKNKIIRLLRRLGIKSEDTMSKYQIENDQSNWEITYDQASEEDEDIFFVEQKIINARYIDLLGESVDFPWHGHSLMDFEENSTKLQKVLKNIEKYNNRFNLFCLKKFNKSVYEAFFYKPIMVTPANDETYCFTYDGRHRIYVAQQMNHMLPVRVIEDRRIRDYTREEYVKIKSSEGSWKWKFE